MQLVEVPRDLFELGWDNIPFPFRLPYEEWSPDLLTDTGTWERSGIGFMWQLIIVLALVVVGIVLWRVL